MASSSNDEDAQWRAKWLLRLPWMTVNSMIDKADRPVYKSLCQLNNDAALIVHNITIFFEGDYVNFYCCSYLKLNFLLIISSLLN